MSDSEMDQSYRISKDKSMLDLFRLELESQAKILNEGILFLESNPQNPEILETLMRAAHSIKGAARIIRMDPVEQLAHLLEGYFVDVQKKKIALDTATVDYFLRCSDFFSTLSRVPIEGIPKWLEQEKTKIDDLSQVLLKIHKGEFPKETEKVRASVLPGEINIVMNPNEKSKGSEGDRVIRIAANSLNRLMGLAGESMVETRWLYPFSESLMKLKKEQTKISNDIDLLRDSFNQSEVSEVTADFFNGILQKTNECRQNLSDRLSELDLFIARHSSLSDRLYSEVVESRMRPFSDGVQPFSRLVRDLAKHMNKKVKLEIIGRSTPVDRDILEKLEGPLSHLIRNAVDHGIETPNERVALGKPPEGLIKLEAEHRAGMLIITVSDDGRGIDIEKLRQIIVEKNLVTKEMAAKLNERELVEFLFLPGFSTSKRVTEISGRGIGLDVVRTMVESVGGSVKVEIFPYQGLSVQLQLPLTLSVIKALLVDIGGEPYAFPLSRIERSLSLLKDKIAVLENRQYFVYDDKNVGLIYAGEVLGISKTLPSNHYINVVLIKNRDDYYGLVVDAFLEERDLVVQEFNTLLGKVPNISSGAFMEDGSPVLIIDVEDLVNTISKSIAEKPLQQLSYRKSPKYIKPQKRILIVEDSVTVREVESRLLKSQGYAVDTAVNGFDGWNAIRREKYDLVITDLDMPRMNGIELIKLIRSDSRYQTLPVIVISYKERESDKAAATQAGANAFLSKSIFHDETLLNVVQQMFLHSDEESEQ